MILLCEVILREIVLSETAVMLNVKMLCLVSSSVMFPVVSFSRLILFLTTVALKVAGEDLAAPEIKIKEKED